MILRPKFTEKALKESQRGRYTFRVPLSLSKGAAKKEIEAIFKVKVASVWSLKRGGEEKQTRSRHRQKTGPQKIIVVTLREGKLDFFEKTEENKSQKAQPKEDVAVAREKSKKL